MNGLSYVMFVTNTSHKEVASDLNLSVQAISKWLHGIKPIPDKHMPYLCKRFGISSQYFQKELSLQDKIEIELQLTSKTENYVDIDFQAATLHRQNENMKEKYMKLLHALEDNARSAVNLKKEVEIFQLKLMGLTMIESLMSDPKGCSLMFDLMKQFQSIRQECNHLK